MDAEEVEFLKSVIRKFVDNTFLINKNTLKKLKGLIDVGDKFTTHRLIERLDAAFDRVKNKNPHVTNIIKTNETTKEKQLPSYIADIETTKNFLSFDYLNIYFCEYDDKTIITKIEID